MNSVLSSLLGINYEGGKIIKHVLKQADDCVAYANVQIRMDSPWHGQVADESQRHLGPSETQFDGYSERRSQMISQLTRVFQKAKDLIETAGDIQKLIVQIARGKACEWFIPDIIMPIIERLGSQIQSKIEIIKGYRSINYYNHKSSDGKFIFINIGMFASVTVSQIVEVCVPMQTLDLTFENTDLKVCCWNEHTDDLGIKLGLTPMILAGLPDDAPFIEPSKYDHMTIMSLFKK